MNSKESPPPDVRLQVLLVEDTLDDALKIRSLLESALGCKVTLAQDGIRGCQLAENQSWDLVVTDLNLPGRDGMEVITTSKGAFPDTPVLAVTGYTGAHYSGQAFRSGADEVLVKPMEPDELIERVRALVGLEEREERASYEEVGPSRTIVAVGALPGDVELGCGGILMGHHAHGHRVVIVVMSAGGEEEYVDLRKGEATESAEILGAELVLADPFLGAIPAVEDMIEWLGEVVGDVQPDTLYTPSLHDVRNSRIRAHQAGLVNSSAILNHYCYQAATTTLEFRPSLFIDVAEYMDRKLESLRAFRGEPEFRPHLQPEIARASATYWGRFLGYGLCEPLEVVRSER
ncbi:MAG: response regulator [Gemmatimonadota bacterium]